MKRISKLVPALLAIWAVFFTACPPVPPPCRIGAPTKQPAAGIPYLGRGAVVNAEEYNHVALGYGDTLTLTFACAMGQPDTVGDGLGVSVSGNSFKLWLVSPVGANRMKGADGLLPPPGLAPIQAKINWPSSAFVFTVTSYDPTQEVWPGDTDLDGYKTMLDLFPIAWAIKHNLGPRPTMAGCANPLGLPASAAVGAMQLVSPQCPWAGMGTQNIQGNPVNAMHADVNMDGTIDMVDVHYLLQVIQPMFLPNFLKTAHTGLDLTARPSTSRRPKVIPNASGIGFYASIPFQIDLVSGPRATIAPDDVLGVVFERPIALPTPQKLLQTRFELESNGLFPPTGSIWGQRYWPGFNLGYAEGGCADAKDTPLDVGLFRLDTLQGGTWPLRCGHCHVDIIDIFSPSVPGNLVPVNLIQHLVNGNVFYWEDGIVKAGTVSCSSDTTKMLLEEICDKTDVMVLDGNDDEGEEPGNHAVTGYSPDLWVTNVPSGKARDSSDSSKVQLKGGVPVLVHVRVRNLSCKELDSAKVSLLWGKGMSDGSNLQSAGEVTVKGIRAMSSKVVTVQWTPPYGSSASTPSPMIDLIAVVDAATDPMTATPPGGWPVMNWVRGSNNLALRSLAYLDPRSSNAQDNSVAIVLPTTPTSLQLMVEQVGFPAAGIGSNYGQVVVEGSGLSLGWGFNAGSQPGSYILESGKGAGGLNVSSGGPIEVSVASVPSSFWKVPLLAGVKFSYKISIVDASSPGTVLGSSLVEFTVP